MDLNEILDELDSWVSSMGNGNYEPPDIVIPPPDLQILPIFGMQQVKEEIHGLIKVILQQPWYSSESTALEIGLGHVGSSHILWRKLFKKITTIEKSHDRVNRFAENTEKYYKKWILSDGKSQFIIGPSQDPKSVEKAYRSGELIDFLFIDGSHSYKDVLADWLLYSPLVKKGGMVVFDDSLLNCEGGGVPRLLKEMESGKFEKTYQIIH